MVLSRVKGFFFKVSELNQVAEGCVYVSQYVHACSRDILPKCMMPTNHALNTDCRRVWRTKCFTSWQTSIESGNWGPVLPALCYHLPTIARTQDSAISRGTSKQTCKVHFRLKLQCVTCVSAVFT